MRNSNDAQTEEVHLCALVCAREQSKPNDTNDFITFVGPPSPIMRSLISRLFMIDPKDMA